ncbi:UNVERIFIED_CONTAM: hypothetical protein K2H54_030212 [Gekko kuhli]
MQLEKCDTKLLRLEIPQAFPGDVPGDESLARERALRAVKPLPLISSQFAPSGRLQAEAVNYISQDAQGENEEEKKRATTGCLCLLYILVTNWCRRRLQAELKIGSFGFFRIHNLSLKFQEEEQTVEIDSIWVSSKLWNQDVPRYLALCFGEVCVRMDLQKAPGLQPPALKVPAQEDAEQSKVLSLGPSLLRLLNQLFSVHVQSVNVMVLHVAASESLWHVQITRTCILLGCDGRCVACEVTFSQVNSKVLKSSQQDDACLAELSLALTVSLDICMSKRQLQGVAVGVWGTHAELHEGLFLSELLWSGGGSPGEAADPSEDQESLMSAASLQYVPSGVRVDLENTSVVLSMNSQKR